MKKLTGIIKVERNLGKEIMFSKLIDFKNRLKIPKGYYCYNEKNNKICPYWRLDFVHSQYQENGYCDYLHKGDWNLNEEITTITEELKQKDGTRIKTVYRNTSWHKQGIMGSLLWDQIKMCSKR